MPAGKFKSRTFRRVQRKTPGGTTVQQYRKRVPGPARCIACGSDLQGVPRARPYKMQNMAKTEKRPERPFGGILCTRCTRKKIKAQARA